MCLKIKRAEDKPRRNRFNERSVLLISMVLVELSTKLRRDYMREPCDNRFCSLLLFKVRKINRFLEICHRDPRKILRGPRNSKLDPRTSIALRIEDQVSSRDCQLTFARYCSSCVIETPTFFEPKILTINNKHINFAYI